jgi:hypothetical protein
VATFSVTVTTTQQATARTALGKILNADKSAASIDQVQEWMLKQLRGAVVQQESRTVVVAQEATKLAALTAEGW